MTNQRIASPAVVVTGDASGYYRTLDEMVSRSGKTSEEMKSRFSQITSGLEQQFGNKFKSIGDFWDHTLNQMERRVTRGNFSPITENTIRGIKQLSDAAGDLDRSLRATAMLDFGSRLQIPKVTADMQRLNTEVQQVASSLQSLSVGQVISKTLGNQANDLAGYNQWLQSRAGSAGIAGTEGYRAAAHGVSSSDADALRYQAVLRQKQVLNDANEAAQMQQRDARRSWDMDLRRTNRQNATAEEQLYNEALQAMAGRPTGPAPSTQMTNVERWQARQAGKEAAALLNAPQYSTQLGPNRSDLIESIRQAGGAHYGLAGGRDTYRLGPIPPNTPTSTEPTLTAEYLARRVDRQARNWAAATDDGGTISQRRNGFGPPDSPTGRRRGTNIEAWDGHRGNRLSGEASNRFRFAAQNVGFGVDDAIQSYQYGGLRASVRAASNNVTAIAGMSIANPIAAAVTVIAISAISAALPAVFDKFGIDRDTRKMSRSQREYFKRTDPGGYGVQIEQDRFVEKTIRDRASTDTLNSSRSQNAFQSLFSPSYGGDIAGQILGLGQTESKLGTNASSKEDLQKRRNARVLENMNRTGFSGWASVLFNNEDSFTAEIDKQLDELDKEKDVLNKRLDDDWQVIQDAKGRIGANRQMMSANRNSARETDQMTSRGELTVEAYHERLKADAARQIDFANRKFTNPRDREAAKFKIENDLANAMADPEGDRLRINANKYQYDESVRNFNSTHGGGTGRTVAAQEQYLSAHYANNFGLEQKTISQEEYNRRDKMLRAEFARTARRGQEDDIDALNPERNPITRLMRRVERDQEDIRNSDLPEETKRQQSLALLRGAENDSYEANRPSGTRRFITEGYQVGSMQDEELRSRMLTGFTKPDEAKQHKDSMTQEEILAELKRWREQRELEATALNN